MVGRAARQRRARSSLLRVSNVVLIVLAFCAGLAVNRLGHHVFSGSSTKSNVPTAVDDTLKKPVLRGIDGGIARLVRKPRGEETVEARPPADVVTTPLPTFVQKVVVAEDKKDEIVPRSQTSSSAAASSHGLGAIQETPRHGVARYELHVAAGAHVAARCCEGNKVHVECR